ncbi:protein phosphatase 2C domain-containing protein [Lentisphaerota bacterium WC36G]|nr:protein phosphatase 2C domain-containing protein [Lentisphaerae bacterium WC36]
MNFIEKFKNLINFKREKISFKDINISGSSHLGLSRKNNEDSYFFLRPNDKSLNFLVGVCDGVGGCEHGEDASSYCSWEIIKAWRQFKICQEGDINTVKKIVSDLIKQINNWTHSINLNSKCDVFGTTLVMGIFFEKCLLLINIGDSRCYQIKKSGKIKQLSKDHSVINDMLKKNIITQDEAIGHPLSHVVSRAIGGDKNCKIDFNIINYKKGDRFLFCSDGLSNYVNKDLLGKYISNKNEKIDFICQKVIKEAINNNGHDNITAVIVNT